MSDGPPFSATKSDAKRDLLPFVFATSIGFPFSSTCTCVGVPPAQQQQFVPVGAEAVVTTIGGGGGGAETTVTGTTWIEQFAELFRPCASVTETVANFVPVVPNETVLIWPTPETSPDHTNVTGEIPPEYPATKFTLLPTVTVGELTEHATLNVPDTAG